MADLGSDASSERRRLPPAIAGRVAPEVAGLTVFAVAARYPTASGDPMTLDIGVEHADAVAAVDVAQRFMIQVPSIIAGSLEAAP